MIWGGQRKLRKKISKALLQEKRPPLEKKNSRGLPGKKDNFQKASRRKKKFQVFMTETGDLINFLGRMLKC